jgi:hypothetical protein
MYISVSIDTLIALHYGWVATDMTREEFREAFLEAQNGLANSLQSLSNLSATLTGLTTTMETVVSDVREDYLKMNEVVATYLDEGGND